MLDLKEQLMMNYFYTIRTMRLLIDIEFFAEILILENIFPEKLWLEPTLKSRK